MRRATLVCLLAMAGPTQAFECSKASTKAEMAICADPAAKAADDDLGKAYSEAISQMSASEKAAAVAAQARWITEREHSCGRRSGAKYTAWRRRAATSARSMRGWVMRGC